MEGASHALAGGAHCGASAVESLPETAEEIAENASAESAPDPSLPFQPLPQGFGAIPGYAPSTAQLGYAPITARPGYASLIRAAQVAFRARQHRKKAVRIIEAAWSEWRFHSELEDCMLIASLIDSLHSVLEVIVDPGALERSHLREVINEGGNQHAIHAIKALGCSHLERLIIVKVAPPLFLFGDSRGGTRRGTDLCPRRRHRQWSSR